MGEKMGLAEHYSIWPGVAAGLFSLVESQEKVVGSLSESVDGSKTTLNSCAYLFMEKVLNTLLEVERKYEDGTHIDKPRVIEEYADALGYLGLLTLNLARACGMPSRLFIEVAAKKYARTCLVAANQTLLEEKQEN